MITLLPFLLCWNKAKRASCDIVFFCSIRNTVTLRTIKALGHIFGVNQISWLVERELQSSLGPRLSSRFFCTPSNEKLDESLGPRLTSIIINLNAEIQ